MTQAEAVRIEVRAAARHYNRISLQVRQWEARGILLQDPHGEYFGTTPQYGFGDLHEIPA